MALGTYSELQQAIGVWLNRSDMASYIPDFITLAATRIYYGSKDPLYPSEPVRIKSMQTSETPVVNGRSIALPTRYLSTIRLSGTNGGSTWNVDYLSPSNFAKHENDSGYSSYYTILNNEIRLSGTTAATYVHDYYQRFAAFASGSDTNDLLTEAPGLWLHGALLEAWLFVRNTAEAQNAYRMFNAVVGGLNDNAARHSGPLAVNLS